MRSGSTFALCRPLGRLQTSRARPRSTGRPGGATSREEDLQPPKSWRDFRLTRTEHGEHHGSGLIAAARTTHPVSKPGPDKNQSNVPRQLTWVNRCAYATDMFRGHAPASGGALKSEKTPAHIQLVQLEGAMADDARPREWPPGEGEVAHRIRAFDWASTPLGPIDSWPQALRSSIQAMLNSRFPINSLLDSSRIEAGRACYQPMDLAALTSGLAGHFRSACERAG